MKKKKLIILITSIISVSVLSIGAINVMAKSENPNISNSILSKYDGKSEQQLKSDLKKLSKNELINEFDVVAKADNDVQANPNLMPFVYEMLQRKADFDNSEIIANIKNNTNTITTRKFMVELYNSNNIGNINVGDNLVKNLLKDSTISNEIKTFIVATSQFDSSDKDLLKDFVEKNDDDLAFQSLKKLGYVDSNEALIISKDIFSNYKSKSKMKVSAAQKFMAGYLKKNKLNNQDLIDKFIKVNSDIISTSNDPLVKDSSVFSLSDMMNKEGITEIINNNSIDRVLKVNAIDQNYIVLKTMLLDNPTEKDIEVVITAMEISPLKELISDLEKSKSTLNNINLKQKCDTVLENMKLNGTISNKKWIEN